MSQYLSPGVYVDEMPYSSTLIEGVSTNTAGFLGLTERGPEAVQLVTNWGEFQRSYGSYIESSYLAHAVYGFFYNGGQRCYIGRIVAASATSSLATVDGLRMVALGRGSWSDGTVQVTIDLSTSVQPRPEPRPASAARLQINVRYNERHEVYSDVSLNPEDSNYLISEINRSSTLIRVWWDDPAAIPNSLPLSAEIDDPNDPTPDPDPNKRQKILVPTVLKGGIDATEGHSVEARDFDGSLDPIPFDANEETTKTPPHQHDLLGRGRGLRALGAIKEISLLLIPDEGRPEYIDQATQVQLLSHKAIAQCEALGDRFAIVCAPQSAAAVTALRPPLDSKFAAFYYPWIKVHVPPTDSVALIPASGHIAGIYVRTDNNQGIHKAPANEVVMGAIALQTPITNQIQEMLNPRGVNCIRDFSHDGRGLRLWGARTMSIDPEWKYINLQRLLIFIQESINAAMPRFIFDPNDETTWANVSKAITNFLYSVWRNGALVGNTPEDAFFVKCDRTTMTEDDINNGQLICLVGIAPLKPAEFTTFTINAQTAD